VPTWRYIAIPARLKPTMIAAAAKLMAIIVAVSLLAVFGSEVTAGVSFVVGAVVAGVSVDVSDAVVHGASMVVSVPL
jgi:hypothetical protein